MSPLLHAPGREIRIYLADGTPTGIRHAELLYRGIQAVCFPKGKFLETQQLFKDQPQNLERPGVYILDGNHDGKDVSYIGEAESVWERLTHHKSSPPIDEWTLGILFTSTTDHLTKAHAKYLESRLQALVVEAGQVRVHKGKASAPARLPQADRNAMEEFLHGIHVLLGCLGFRHLAMPLVPQSTPPTTEAGSPPQVQVQGSALPMLYFKVDKHNVDARGVMADDGFYVLKDSVGAATETGALSEPNKALRNELIAKGDIAIEGKISRFTKNVRFGSSSAAASVIVAGVRNGRVEWKTQEGVMLKTLEEQQSSTKTAPLCPAD